MPITPTYPGVGRSGRPHENPGAGADRVAGLYDLGTKRATNPLNSKQIPKPARRRDENCSPRNIASDCSRSEPITPSQLGCRVEARSRISLTGEEKVDASYFQRLQSTD